MSNTVKKLTWPRAFTASELNVINLTILLILLLLLTFKALNGLALTYITELLDRYVPPCPLRSSSRGLLKVPRSDTTVSMATDHFPSDCAPTL